MEEKYQQYRKSLKGKHSFGFFTEPSYKEDFSISIKPRVAIYLFAKALEQLEWGIAEFNDEELYGARLNKKGKELQALSVLYKDLFTLEIKSESKDKNGTDWGKNYKNVKLLIHVYQELTAQYTRQRYEETEKELDKRYTWEDYKLPEALPVPPVYKEANKRKFIFGFMLICIPLLVVNFVFSFCNLSSWVIVSEVGWSFFVAYALKYLFRWSWYNDEKTIREISYVIVITVLLISIGINYAGMFITEKFHPVSAWNYWKYLPHVSLDWGIVLSTFIIKIYTVAFLYLIPNIYIPIRLYNFTNWKYPEEVINLVYYFKVKKKSTNNFIKAELSKRGWTDERLQKELIEIVETDYTD